MEDPTDSAERSKSSRRTHRFPSSLKLLTALLLGLATVANSAPSIAASRLHSSDTESLLALAAYPVPGHKKILITGFKPFIGRKANVTEDITAALEGRQIAGVTIRTAVSPVEWGVPKEKIQEAIDKIKEEGQQLVAILGLGECGGKEKIRPEKKAQNRRGKAPDEAKKMPGDHVGTETIPGGPVEHTSPLLDDIQTALMNAGIAFDQPKGDAGRYLCEESFYVGMQLTSPGDKKPGRAGFTHLPAYPNEGEDKTDPANAAHLGNMQTAVEKILEALAKKFGNGR